MSAPAAGLALACALVASCATHPGDRCKKDEDCGPGFDCFHEVCVRVCTKDAECAAGETCFHYRCTPRNAPAGQAAIPGGASPSPGATPSAPGAVAVPPLPDTNAAELRAIRRELELLREGQQRILDALEHGGGSQPSHQAPGATPPSAPRRSPAAPPPRGNDAPPPGTASPHPPGNR